MKTTLITIAVFIAYCAIFNAAAETFVALNVPAPIFAVLLIALLLSPFWIAKKILN